MAFNAAFGASPRWNSIGLSDYIIIIQFIR